MGAWVALVLAIGAGGPVVLETRYFDSVAACEAWAARITTPPGPASDRQVASCHHVRELIARLAQGR